MATAWKLTAMTLLPLSTTMFTTGGSAPSEQLASMSCSKLIKEGQVSFYEFEVFEVDGDKVVFRPFPGGKQATPLALVDCDPQARKAVFENPTKDFPTRIVYHRRTDSTLVITLSDPHGGSNKVERFKLKRQSTP